MEEQVYVEFTGTIRPTSKDCKSGRVLDEEVRRITAACTSTCGLMMIQGAFYLESERVMDKKQANEFICGLLAEHGGISRYDMMYCDILRMSGNPKLDHAMSAANSLCRVLGNLGSRFHWTGRSSGFSDLHDLCIEIYRQVRLRGNKKLVPKTKFVEVVTTARTLAYAFNDWYSANVYNLHYRDGAPPHEIISVDTPESQKKSLMRLIVGIAPKVPYSATKEDVWLVLDDKNEILNRMKAGSK